MEQRWEDIHYLVLEIRFPLKLNTLKAVFIDLISVRTMFHLFSLLGVSKNNLNKDDVKSYKSLYTLVDV